MFHTFSTRRTRTRTVAAMALALSLSTCTCADAPAPVLNGPLPLDTVLGPGEVRCGPVTKASELIGGPAAYGEVGRSFRCHNARIRFLIQDASRPGGNSVEGGSLIDIDVVREDELADGEDTFREYLPLLGANEVRVESIEVINDGRNGKAGILRVTGRPTTITLAPQAVFLSQDITGTIFTDYVLEPDTDVIAITTTLVNEGDLVQGGLGADFLAFGGATPPTNPERGFGDVPLFSQVSFLAGSRGKGSNIGFVCDGRDLTIPLVESGATVAICDDNLFIGSEGGYTRFIVVGDGSLDSVARRAWELRGIATGSVDGTVAGAIVGDSDDVVVTALSASLADADAHAVSEARVKDGAFRMTLPPGDYVLIAHVPGQTGAKIGRSAEVAVSVVAGGEASAALVLGAHGHIDVATDFFALDGSAEPAHPAKLTLVPLEGTERAVGEVLHDFEKGGASRYEVSKDGVFSVDVPPGRWRLLVTRGFEWSRHDVEVDVVADGAVAVTAILNRALDTEGFLAGEFHQHTLGSIDAVVPLPLKVLENAAEGIEIAVSTDHDNIVDFTPFVNALGLSSEMRAFPGEEVSYQAIGHFNAYPFLLDPNDPFRDIGSRLWWLKTLPQMYADIRSAAGNDAIIQLNHPRSSGNGALQAMNFDPSDGHRIPRAAPTLPTLPADVYEKWSPAFDSLEVNTNLGNVDVFAADGVALRALAEDDPLDVPVLADWFGLMGSGLAVAAMGNSDSHQIDEGVGYPRTFLFAGSDDPTGFDEAGLRNTIRAQKTAIGEGCLLVLEVDGTPRMGRPDLVTAADAARLTARLQAPPHVTVGRFEVYVNGVAQKLVADSVASTIDVADVGVLSLPLAGIVGTGAVRLEHRLTNLPLSEDAVVVVVSRAGSGLAPTGGGEVICISPAVYVDADADGAFSPWLASTEDVTRLVE